jgi:hypothetical protein
METSVLFIILPEEHHDDAARTLYVLWLINFGKVAVIDYIF